MKKIIVLIIALFNLTLFAQSKEGKDKIHAYKIAYLTEKLNLSTSQAEKFWPIYNDYSKNRREVYKYEKKKIKESIEEKGGVEKLSDKEAEIILDKINQLKNDQHKNKLKMMSDLKSFLTPKKILQFQLAESEFNKKMMKRLKEQKGCN